MAITYRAIWQDSRERLDEVVVEAFEAWALDKHPGVPLDGTVRDFCSPRDGRLVWGNRNNATIGDEGRAVELVLREDSEEERWISTVRVVSGRESWVWVDVERNTFDPWTLRPQIIAPNLVRELITSGRRDGGDPRWGVIRMFDRAIAVDADKVQEQVLNRLRSPLRRSPDILVAHSYNGGSHATLRRANIAASRMVGAASVLVLSEEAVAKFNEEAEESARVNYGEARLFLPSDEGFSRNRLINKEDISQHPKALAIKVGLLLQPGMSNRLPPPALDEALAHLRQNRIGEYDDLLQLAEEELGEERDRVGVLRSELKASQEETFDHQVDLEGLEEEIGRLNRLIISYRIGANEVEDSAIEVPTNAFSVSDAIEKAREFLSQVVIPEGVERDIEELDQSPSGRSWGSGAWRGFRALDAYSRASSEVQGGFFQWCQLGGPEAWPATAKKYSAVESETVRSHEPFRKARVLPVSTEVDPTGQIFMEQHLKIAEGGGEQAPRVYFYDDTGGTTGKVHVGFVGPHRHMPNKSKS